MTTAERLARQLLGLLETGDVEQARDLVTAGFVDHAIPPEMPTGPDGYVEALRFLSDVLKFRYEIHDTVASGDKVAVRATAHGVHNADHLGVPPTGRPFHMSTMHIYRVEGGRVAEHWAVRDEYDVLVQVGAFKPQHRPDQMTIPD